MNPGTLETEALTPAACCPGPSMTGSSAHVGTDCFKNLLLHTATILLIYLSKLQSN